MLEMQVKCTRVLELLLVMVVVVVVVCVRERVMIKITCDKGKPHREGDI